ncbi:MAG: hypothetical protein WAN35_18520 [Terracidiphilus sp.]
MRPFLRISMIFLLLFAAFFLGMTESANAQVWVSSGFKPGSDAKHETAYCSTSAIDPATGQISPAATEYEVFSVGCIVTASTGATFTILSNQSCTTAPFNYLYFGDAPFGQLYSGNTMETCNIDFQPLPGVEYTINSVHWLSFYTAPQPPLYTPCSTSTDYMWCGVYSDPQGYMILPLKFGPVFSTLGSNIVQEITGSMTGTGVDQNFPLVAAINDPSYLNSFGGSWQIASTSAQYIQTSAIITDTSDIMNGNVTVKLTAPAGTTGELNLDFNGSDNSGLQLSQATFPALTPDSQNLQLPSFDTILPGIYPMANGNWNALIPGNSSMQTVTVPDYTLPTPWTYFRKIFYTQYNVPHENACSGGDEDAWLVTTSVVKGKTTCNFTKIKLNSQFVAATWMNGTGIDLDGDVLKNAAAVNLGSAKGQLCHGQYPDGPIGNGEWDGNTFAVVNSISGSCPGRTLVAGQSLAMPRAIIANVIALSCGDQLNLDSGDYTTEATRTVDDICPKCWQSSTFHGADGHIDAFSSDPSCTGQAVGHLGFFYTSYPTN